MAYQYTGDIHRVDDNATLSITDNLTVSCWFRVAQLSEGGTNFIVSKYLTSGNQRAYGLFREDQNVAFSIQTGNFKGDQEAVSTTDPIAAIDTWYHLCGVFIPSTSTTVYFNGSSVATASSVESSVGDTTAPLDIGGGSGTSLDDGQIAEVAIWNASLDTNEIATLAAGYSPEFVRRESLVAYWPLVRDLIDKINGQTLSVETGSPTVTAHPRIIYPRRSRHVFSPETVTPVSNLGATNLIRSRLTHSMLTHGTMQ